MENLASNISIQHLFVNSNTIFEFFDNLSCINLLCFYQNIAFNKKTKRNPFHVPIYDRIVPIFVASSSAEDGSVSAKRHSGQGAPVRLSPVHRTVFCRARRRPPVGSAASVGLRSGSIGRPAHGGTMRESLFLASETGAAESAAGFRPRQGFLFRRETLPLRDACRGGP